MFTQSQHWRLPPRNLNLPRLNPRKWCPRRWNLSLLAILLLFAFGLTGCDDALFGGGGGAGAPQSSGTQSSGGQAAAGQVTANLNEAAPAAFEPSLELDPPHGHGGIYVRVRGAQWPPNMLVLVTLEDAQGRSSTLASNDTDQSGNLATGFLYPIDQRWLETDNYRIVATTADGRVETSAEFAIVPPGTEMTASAAITATGETASGSVGMTESVGMTQSVGMTEAGGHTVVLPLVTADVGAGDADTEPNGDTSATTSGGPVRIEIEPGSDSRAIHCRDPHAWITFAILSDADFDASSVEPGSVTVTGESSSATVYPGNAAAYRFMGQMQSRTSTTVWRWHMEDVNEDGLVDLVMQFRLDYIDLDCEAVAIIVGGQTNDGRSFEGRAQVEMAAADRG